MPTAKERAEAKRRSDAAKKAAATRKANAEAAAAEAANGDTNDADTAQSEDQVEGTTETTLAPYSPSHPELANAGLDQHDAEAKRQAELAEERRVHNVRTGNPVAPLGFKY